MNVLPMKFKDIKSEYRDELQLIEVPEIERGKYVVQQHIRGIGMQENEYVRVHKSGGETTRRQIGTLLEDDNWKSWQVQFKNANELLTEALNIPTGDRWEDIDDLYKLGEFKDSNDEEFNLYDIKTKSIDRLSLLDASCHLDWRFEMNDHLSGITVYDPGRTGDPQKIKPVPGMNGDKTVIGEKAPHIPSEWLTISGKNRGDVSEIEPGEVGATEYSLGLFITYDFGEWEPGCLPLDEKIITPTGLKKVQNISEEDLLLGQEGKEISIKNKMTREIDENIIKIIPRQAPPIKTTKEHPFLIAEKKNTRRGIEEPEKIEWTRADEINEEDYLAIPRIKKEKDLWINYGDMRLKIDEELAWLIGHFIGDGYTDDMARQVSFFKTKNEEKWIKKIERILKDKFDLDPKRQEKTGCWEIYANSTYLRDTFSRFYDEEGKKRIPYDFLYADSRIIKELIRGFWAADGKKDTSKIYAISNTSYQPIHILHLMAAKLGFAMTYSRFENKGFASGKKRRDMSNPFIHQVSWSKNVFDPDVQELSVNDPQYNIWFCNEDYILIKIKEIEKERYEGTVFNFETEDNTICSPLVTHNSIKPYYMEWFTYSDEIEDANELKWNAREVSLPPLEPEKKLPEEEQGETLRYLLWCPEDQVPYAVSDRAKEKKWVAEDYDPVPEYWKEDNPEEYKEYQEWAQKIREEEGRDIELQESIPFKIKYVWSQGPFVVRGTRNEWYYLQMKTPEGLKEWELGDDIRYDNSTSAQKSETDEKYWDYVGELDPRTRYNPHKELVVHMEDMIEGKVEYEKSTEDGVKRINLKFDNKDIKGNWVLEQSSEESDVWSFSKEGEQEMSANNFTVQHHYWGDAHHWDISMTKPDKTVEEGFKKFALVSNPINAKTSEQIKIVKNSTCNEPKWFSLDDKEIPPEGAPDWLEGGNPTKNLVAHVDLLDSGTFDIINWTDRFIDVVFNGDKLNGHYIFKKGQNGWYFEKSAKPGQEMISGDPHDEPLDPFVVTKSDDEINVDIFSTRFFTSALPQNEYDRYDLPTFPDSVRPMLMKYSEEGTVGQVAIQSVSFDKENWTEDEAIDWIETKGLSEWSSEYKKD